MTIYVLSQIKHTPHDKCSNADGLGCESCEECYVGGGDMEEVTTGPPPYVLIM